MDCNLRKNISLRAITFGLAALALILGILTSFLGVIIMPIYTGVLAAIFLFDKSYKRTLVFSISFFICILSVILGNHLLFEELFSAIIAFIICFMFKQEKSKGECVGYVTFIFSVMLIILFASSAFLAKETFSFEALTTYYKEFYQQVKTELLKHFYEVIAALPEGIDTPLINEQDIIYLLDTLVFLIPSLIVIISFVGVGIAFKLFSLITSRTIAKPELIINWRFSTDNVFAYSFIVIMILSAFIRPSDVFGIAVNNLYNVLLVVYAYIGFNFSRALLMQRKSYMYSTLVLLILVFLLSSLGVSILALIGVYFTIGKNKTFNKLKKDR